MKGRYVPSLLAAIGDVIEEHMIRIGFLTPEGAAALEPARTLRTQTGEAGEAGIEGAQSGEISGHAHARICPRCANRSLQRIEGCWTCSVCQYSRCG
jgi:ribonucleoside-diphosphate reductase alpha chain